MVLNDRLHISVYCSWKILANPILIFPILRPYKLSKGDALLYSLGSFIIHPVISLFFIFSLILFLFIFLLLFHFLVLVGLLASLSSVQIDIANRPLYG